MDLLNAFVRDKSVTKVTQGPKPRRTQVASVAANSRRAAPLVISICSRPSVTQPSRSNRRSKRVTISRTVPNSSAKVWWVTAK